MTAPTAPPATSVAKTAAQVATLLDPASTDTGYLCVYLDASDASAPGFTSASLRALLRNAPQSSTPKTAAQFVTALAANGTKKIYAFLEDTVDAGAYNFDVADLVPLLNAVFPQYGTTAVRTIRASKDAIKWTTPGTVPAPASFFTEGDLLIIENDQYEYGYGLFYKVLGGSDSGKYIRSEDTIPVVR